MVGPYTLLQTTEVVGRQQELDVLTVQPGGLEVYELDEQGRYQLTAKVNGDEVFAAHRPFPVQVCPARLLDGLRPR